MLSSAHSTGRADACLAHLIHEVSVSDISSLPPSEPSLPGFQPDARLPRKKARRTLWIVLGSVVGVILLCLVLAVVVIGRNLLNVATEQTAITPVIDRFMHLMNQRDAQAAYQLFSSRAQRQTPMTDVMALVEEPNYVLFDGYQSTTINSTNLTSTVNTNQDVPQGQVATVSGSISYTDGTKGSFRATLEQEDGDWRLFFINVTVPPSKVKSAP